MLRERDQMKSGWKTVGCFCCMAAAIGIQGASSDVAAHPHVWVTVNTEVVFGKDQSINGFRHKWTFDEYYSSFAIQGLDANGDGAYDRKELEQLAEINIVSLKDFGYFTFPKLAGEVLERSAPKDYWLEYDGTQLTLFLTLPLAESVASDKVKDFTFGVFDPTFYVDFAFAKDTPVNLAGAPTGCKPEITESDPAASQVSVSGLGEAFFESLDGTSTEAEKYARKISITCPAS
ncbi:MAG: DUF1007 family protein [Hyphomicrobiales bacterium]|nr:DUF1007 family protein [Hyphomicrobiales bacterium]